MYTPYFEQVFKPTPSTLLSELLSMGCYLPAVHQTTHHWFQMGNSSIAFLPPELRPIDPLGEILASGWVQFFVYPW